METPSADNVAEITRKVAAYGSQLAGAFHRYELSERRGQRGLEDAMITLDATVASLNRILTLLGKDEAAGVNSDHGKRLFSEEGLKYVRLLSRECAVYLAKLELIVREAASLEPKELREKHKQDKKASAKVGKAHVDLSVLKLDEEAFLDILDNTRWYLIHTFINDYSDRLREIQLGLLLVFEVVSVGALSNPSSGTIDLSKVVAYYDRIIRTTDLIGINPNRPTLAIYDLTSDDSLGEFSDSDSDATSIVSRVGKKKASGLPPPPPGPRPSASPFPLPPPPPTNWPSGPPPPRPPTITPKVVATLRVSETPTEVSGPLSDNTKPPSYSERPAPAITPATPEKASVLPSASKDEKEKEKTIKEVPVQKDSSTLTAPEPRLFKSKPNGFRFKLKSIFRSKDSLAEEMKRTLNATDSHLLAFVIRDHDIRQIPHSAFHLLEATHMKTILSQLSTDEWYNTFTNLNSMEHASLDRLVHPYAQGKINERELVVLKVIQQNRFNAWMALLREILQRFPTPYGSSRILLAIVREKLVDGKPLLPFYYAIGPPPGPPPPPPPPFPVNVLPPVRPPPGLRPPPSQPSRIVDLSRPSQGYSSHPGPSPPALIPIGTNGPYTTSYPGGPPRPPPPPGSRPPPGPPPGAPPGARPPAGQTIASMRISDTTPLTDYDATLALTTYNEYTLRLSEALDPSQPRTWSRVAITHESSERNALIQRVQMLQRIGFNVIEAKLRLTEQQSGQLTRLMDDIKLAERDVRFEWSWAEISLYSATNYKIDLSSPIGGQGGPPRPNMANAAVMMHVIGKRAPKQYVKPLDLYNLLMRPPPPPPPPPPTLPAPEPMKMPMIVDLSPAKKSTDTKKKSKKERKGKGKGRRFYDDSSDSDSDSSLSSGSAGRRSLVDWMARMPRKGRKVEDVSESGSESEREAPDVVLLSNLGLKKGDDVVKKLVELWTPVGEGKDEGKEEEEKCSEFVSKNF